MLTDSEKGNWAHPALPLDVPKLATMLFYNPNTGALTWRIRTAETHPDMTDGQRLSWNNQFAGQIAGCQRVNGYVSIKIAGRSYKAHRIAWALFYGKEPDGQIDHKNGVKSDNRITNLRDVSLHQNSLNRRLNCNNSSGFPGVYWREDRDKWSAEICFRGRRRRLGLFDKKADAVVARKRAEASLGFFKHHGAAI